VAEAVLAAAAVVLAKTQPLAGAVAAMAQYLFGLGKSQKA